MQRSPSVAVAGADIRAVVQKRLDNDKTAVFSGEVEGGLSAVIGEVWIRPLIQ